MSYISKYLIIIPIILIGLITISIINNSTLITIIGSISLIFLTIIFLINLINYHHLYKINNFLKKDQADLTTANNELLRKINSINIVNQHSQIENTSLESKDQLLNDLIYLDYKFILLNSLLKSIPERTLNETSEAINKINTISDTNKENYENTIQFLNQVLGSAGCDNTKTSFRCVEDSAMRLEEITTQMIQNINTSNTAGEHFMTQVETKMSNIKNFIKKIEDISESTHVLSINASIEAAKSGKVAKGFSVIAGEIKKLASQAKSSADTIRNMIIEAFEATQQLKEQYESMFRDITSQINKSKDELEEIFAILTQSYKDVTEMVKATSESFNQSTTNFNNVVYYHSQSQDILSQQINHIQNIIKTIELKIESINKLLEQNTKSSLNHDSIKKQVAIDVYKLLTMDIERKYVKKCIQSDFHLDPNILDEHSNKGVQYTNRTKEYFDEELSDTITLF